MTLVLVILSALVVACSNKPKAVTVDPALQQAQTKFKGIENPQGSDPAWLRNVKRSDTTFEAQQVAYNEIITFVNSDLSKLGNEYEARALKDVARALLHGRANNYVRALLARARNNYRDLRDIENALKVMKESRVIPTEVGESEVSIRLLIVQKVEESFKGENGLLVAFNGSDGETAMNAAKILLDTYNFTPTQLEKIGLTTAKAEEIHRWKPSTKR